MAQDKKQFIVSASLKDAPPGDKQIARDWAFHKIYYLISELQYNENNQALIDAINGLCAKFHIITPYSFNYHKPHKASARVNVPVRKSKEVHSKP